MESRVIFPLFLILFTEAVYAKLNCDPQQEYMVGKRCCRKCPPGMFALERCTDKADTYCRPCRRNEYQPDWNYEARCLPQKYCDEAMGFDPVQIENRTAAVLCRCLPGRQCSLVNCEFCDHIPVCGPGWGTAIESGYASCKPCQHGSFSNISSATEPCKQWTNCRALGLSRKQDGDQQSDAACEPYVGGSSTSLVLVVILSVIFILSLVLLVLYFYKDKVKPISANVGSCVHTLKQRSIQQESVPAPFINTRAPHNNIEITSLISHEKTHLDSIEVCTNKSEPCDRVRSQSGGLASPISPSEPCVCGSPAEPLEVGENEDCSQAVAACTCGASALRDPCHLCRQTEESVVTSGSAPTLEMFSIRDNSAALSLQTCSLSVLGSEQGCEAQSLTSEGPEGGESNTTFLSNNHMMNFCGGVIVLYMNEDNPSNGIMTGNTSVPIGSSHTQHNPSPSQ